MIITEDRLFFILSIGFAIFLFIIERILILREKRTTALTFIENKCITLFSPLIENIEDLKITYQKKTITDNLIFYQATIYNSGVSDISDSSIYEPLSLKLPIQYKWKSFKFYDKSEGLTIDHTIDKNILKLDWTLFKKQEYFRFDTVIEYTGDIVSELGEHNSKQIENKITNSLSNKISFSNSRIVNLQVFKRNIKTYESFLRWGKTAIYSIIILLSLRLLLLNKSDKIVQTVDINTISTPVEFSFNRNKQIVLIDSLRNEILYDTINSKLTISKIEIVNKEDLKYKNIYYPKTMIILCMIMFFFLFEQKRIRNTRERMKLVSSGDWNPYKEEDC